MRYGPHSVVAAFVVLTLGFVLRHAGRVPIDEQRRELERLIAHDGTETGRDGGGGEAVVIAGAWRSTLRPAEGHRRLLSRAFKQRVRAGLFTALRTGIDTVVFTGGQYDAIDARRWAIENFAAADEERQPQTAAAAAGGHNHSAEALEVTIVMCGHNVTDTGDASAELVTAGLESLDMVVSRRLRLLMENVSVTTETNALEARRLLQRQGVDGGSVVVVSSPYHLARCRLHFGRHFPQGSVIALASSSHEFEVVLPQNWFVWVTVRFVNMSSDAPRRRSEATTAVDSRQPSPVAPPSPSAPGQQSGSGSMARPGGRNANGSPVHPLALHFPLWAINLAHTFVFNWREHLSCLMATLRCTSLGALAHEVYSFAVDVVLSTRVGVQQ